MRLKKIAMTLAVALISFAFVPPEMALATGPEISKAGPTRAAHEAAHDDENPGESAQNPDEGADANETVSDSGENSDEPGHHDDSGDDGNESGDDDDDESGGVGRCASVSSVSVCVDQPR